MRKLIILEYITLDGVIQAAGGSQEDTFKLTDGKISRKGVIIANYERAGEVETGSV
jgi:hypothetical protein